MSKKMIVNCDICKKELSPDDQLLMSTVIVDYREAGAIKKFKQPDKKFISKSEHYEIQLCEDHAPDFMEYLKKYIEDNEVKN